MSSPAAPDPIQAMLAQTSLQRNLFTPTSRYYGLDTTTMTAPDGTAIIYLRRRFVPAPGAFQLLQYHTVAQNERLDVVAAQYLSDAELFWQIADANTAMRPEDLVAKVGRRLRITLPQGITGGSL